MAIETIQCKRTFRWSIALNGVRIPFLPLYHTEEEAEGAYRMRYPTAHVITTESQEHSCHKEAA